MISESPPASRRVVVRGAAAASLAAAATAATPARAAADETYRPARYRRGPRILGARARHLVGRFSYGITPALAKDVRRAGGARSWFEAQLAPDSVSDEHADELDSWWPSLHRTAEELWQRQADEVEGVWEVVQDYQRWALLRRMRSRRQVLETMTEFWENHFNVPATGDAQGTWRAAYGRTIRQHALGRVEDLIQGVIVHPAMLINLDNVSSTKQHPNENLGRELLELYTVGRGHYTEADVKESARILTGWTVDMWDTFAEVYRPRWHSRGPVEVMGFRHPNDEADGRPVTRDYLSYLARHPATAQRIAHRLCVKFVSDEPPAELVDQLAAVYLAHDTDIRPVLRTLVDSAAFAAAVGAKVRDPGEDLVATYRALDVRVARPTAESTGRHASDALLWQVASLGTMPFDWPRPDGQPIDNVSWSSASRMLASMDVHMTLSGGWWPTEGARYRKDAAWVPKFPMRFDKLVDHLSRTLLHQPSTSTLLQACCEAVDIEPHARITRKHPLVRWNMQRLLTTFLDSPAFLTR